MFRKSPPVPDKKPGEQALERALYWVRQGNTQQARIEVKRALVELKSMELGGKD